MNNKGAEWSRWDLHFHTPSSFDYKDRSVTDADIIEGMAQNGISAFAITDHHLIDIPRYRNLASLAKEKNICVLPGIEFLADARASEPIHFIGIFSERSNIDYIWGQLQHRTNIAKIARDNCKQNEIYCELMKTIELVKELGGIITIHAGQKSNSLETITNSLPHTAAQKTDIAMAVDIYELGKESDQHKYRTVVFPAIKKTMPMIICSDNHNIRDYKIKQKLWIKGSPNFEGLRYALNEPEDRFFIGDEPPVVARVRLNKTKYISSISIKNNGKHDEANVWFDNIQIPLNNELVTVIGNKGSGKSALSDIIALCADGDHSGEYVFLHKEKFKKRGLADRFVAQLTFVSGHATGYRSLDHKVDESQERLVRYLPQSYFEKVCNEVGKIEKFRAEIEKVVFQYVPHQNRLKKATFAELVEFKKQAIEVEIRTIIEEMHEINTRIVLIEDKLSPEFKKNLLSQKRVKEEEHLIHLNSKPVPPLSPQRAGESAQNIQNSTELDEWRGRQTALEAEIKVLRDRVSDRLISIQQLGGIKRDISAKVDEIRRHVEIKAGVASAHGVDLSTAFEVRFDSTAIDEKIKELEGLNRADSVKVAVAPAYGDTPYEQLNLAGQHQYCAEKIIFIEKEFTREQKEYKAYLDALKEWEDRRTAIEGEPHKAGTLAYISSTLQAIDESLPAELSQLRADRVAFTEKIFGKKSEIKAIYDEIKNEIDEQLLTANITGLNIVSAFYAAPDMKIRILQNIRKNRAGTFYGLEDGAQIMQDRLISPTDWNSFESVREFLNSLVEHLEHDKRGGIDSDTRTFIGDIVADRMDLYNYLFSLSYLEPHYDLRHSGKSLEQLSPGEKGALLLVFYLVLDKEDIPLIIDQPEDNLDNNSVAKVLVPFIRAAKKKRQIIMVTHNPNLAVVSDSEQVIRVSIDKENGNVFAYISGGIESERIKNEIVDVLEGTAKAFVSRKMKYQIQ